MFSVSGKRLEEFEAIKGKAAVVVRNMLTSEVRKDLYLWLLDNDPRTAVQEKLALHMKALGWTRETLVRDLKVKEPEHEKPEPVKPAKAEKPPKAAKAEKPAKEVAEAAAKKGAAKSKKGKDEPATGRIDPLNPTGADKAAPEPKARKAKSKSSDAPKRKKVPDGVVVPEGSKWCPKCGEVKVLAADFGMRTVGEGKVIPQPWCRPCRGGASKLAAAKRKATAPEASST